jgi:hypothetical protein
VKLLASRYHQHAHDHGDPSAAKIQSYCDAKMIYTTHMCHLVDGKSATTLTPSHQRAWQAFHKQCGGQIPVHVVVTTGTNSGTTRYHLQVGDVLINWCDDDLVRIQCITHEEQYKYLQSTTHVYDLPRDLRKQSKLPQSWFTTFCERIVTWNTGIVCSYLSPLVLVPAYPTK